VTAFIRFIEYMAGAYCLDTCTIRER